MSYILRMIHNFTLHGFSSPLSYQFNCSKVFASTFGLIVVHSSLYCKITLHVSAKHAIFKCIGWPYKAIASFVSFLGWYCAAGTQ
jgi:hypothetical protein